MDNIIQVFQLGADHTEPSVLLKASYNINNDQYSVDNIEVYPIKDGIVQAKIDYNDLTKALIEVSILKFLTTQNKDT